MSGGFTTMVSYQARVLVTKRVDKLMRLTIKEYRRLLVYLTIIITANWTNIGEINGQQKRLAYVERLINRTKQNPTPKYDDFNLKFPNLPCYLRRAGINAVLGNHQSYISNYKNWEENGKQGKPPRISYHPHNAPVFYRKGMIKYPNSEKDIKLVHIKLYNGATWDYYPIAMRKTDANYINNKIALDGWSLKCPSLKMKGNKRWVLRFSFETTCQLSTVPIEEQRVCAVDLGVNTDATCCVMEHNGTIVARKFINFAADKAKMYHLTNKIRQAQSQGARKLKKKWGRVNRINDELVIKITNAIIDFAIQYSCTTIVCEYLSFEGKIKGTGKQRRHLWRKRAVYRRLLDVAHRWGMRVRQVCAWGTSRLAYDGSGEVQRGKYIVDDQGKSLGLGYCWVRFSSGKLYNADLNAAYNIGARFFVRELLKTDLVTERSGQVAEVLRGQSGSTFTWSTLINLGKVLWDRQVTQTPSEASLTV